MKSALKKLIPWGLCTGIFVIWNIGCSSERPAFTEGASNSGKSSQDSDGKDLTSGNAADSNTVDSNTVDSNTVDSNTVDSNSIDTDKTDSNKANTIENPNFIDANGDGINDNIATNSGTDPNGVGTGPTTNVTDPSTDVKPLPTTNNVVTDETVTQYKNDCTMALSKGLVKSFKQAVFFPAIKSCPWNKSENLGALNGSIQARVEQYQDVAFPKLSRVCGIKFNFPTQSMQFDDEIILTFGKYVVGSSQNYGNGYRGEDRGFAIDADGYQTYSWVGQHGLRELFYDHGVTPKFCLPHTTCAMPLTETEGNMSINIPDAEAIRLGLKSGIQFDSAAASQAIKIGFTTTGDNDDSDCSHLDFKFDVTFNYVE